MNSNLPSPETPSSSARAAKSSLPVGKQTRSSGNARRGAPAWITTYADMVTLLLAFFVLLFSFSEIEIAKLEMIAGSLAQAFGVQRETPAESIPKGDSVIAEHFEPGERQPIDQLESPPASPDVQKIAEQLRTAMQAEIDSGLIDIKTQGQKIIVRIRQAGSFPMGSADIDPTFLPVLAKLRKQLSERQGRVSVAGHTDGLSINTYRFRSNWDLSAARAVSVVHELRKDEHGLQDKRLEVRGLADTQPLEANKTAAGRARNRRVEITFEPK